MHLNNFLKKNNSNKEIKAITMELNEIAKQILKLAASYRDREDYSGA